jgi:hypothetical protein
MKVFLKEGIESNCKTSCLSMTNQILHTFFYPHKTIGKIYDKKSIKAMLKEGNEEHYIKIVFPSGINKNGDQPFIELTAHKHLVQILNDDEVLVFEILNS